MSDELTIADTAQPIHQYLLLWQFPIPQPLFGHLEPSKGIVILSIEENERRLKREAHGFTRDDVRLLKSEAWVRDNHLHVAPPDLMAQMLRALADRIEALLPPEDAK
jgi:hypothetical protein